MALVLAGLPKFQQIWLEEFGEILLEVSKIN